MDLINEKLPFTRLVVGIIVARPAANICRSWKREPYGDHDFENTDSVLACNCNLIRFSKRDSANEQGSLYLWLSARAETDVVGKEELIKD